MAAVVPTVLDFGAEPFQDGNGFKATVRKEAMGRQVLGQVTNLDLNLSRAGKTFAPGAQVERDQAQAAEDFSQVKFTYLELSAKHDFIRILTMDGLDKVDPKVEAEQEQMLQDGKDGLKSLKERSKKLKIEVEDQLRDACRKYEQLQAEAEQFRALIQSGNYAEQEVAATRLAELDTATLQQQEVIKKQEESIRILSDERKELSMAVRGLDAEVIELSERAHPSIEDIQDHRAAAWFHNANTVLSTLSGVSDVMVKESEVEVLFGVFPFTRGSGSSRQQNMDKKSYTLTLEFKNGNENLTGAHIAPPDVDMSDITSASVTAGGGTKGVAYLLAEVRSRLSCRLALVNELEQLKSRFSFTMQEEAGAVLLGFTPAVGKNASRWRCEVIADVDYPREHVKPELESVRNGAFQSPGAKRERAIIDSISKAGHATITEMLEAIAGRLNA